MCILCFYVQSMYRIYSKRYMSSVIFVSRVVSCFIYFYFLIYFVTNESMNIVMMIQKKGKKRKKKREYLSWAVNVLTNITNISNITQRKIFQLNFCQRD